MLVARLLASDFPSENPRTQTRNFPYTNRWAQLKKMKYEKSRENCFLRNDKQTAF